MDSAEFSNRAVVLKAFGSYNCLSIEKFPLLPLEGHVEVEVQFCGLNFADLYTRQGLMAFRTLPFVLGMECTGVIKATGCPENTDLKVGQRVICYDYLGGMYQDIIRVKPSKCYPLPDDVSFEQGAAIFVSYLTAYFSLFEMGSLKPNDTILVQSCAGGLGCAATQLAKTVEGVKVIGTCSKAKEEAAKANGVDHVLSYENLEKNAKEVCPEGFDIIVDNQGAKVFVELQELLKPLGRIIMTGVNSIITDDKKLGVTAFLKTWWNTKSISPTTLILNNRTVSGLHLGVLAEKEPVKMRKALETMFALLKDGKIQPKIDSVWPLEEAITAMKMLGERCNVGKVLLSAN